MTRSVLSEKDNDVFCVF